MPVELEAQQKRVDEVLRRLNRDKDRLLTPVSPVCTCECTFDAK
jgi:hypothetical protein